MLRLSFQSVSDLITNSSSEVFRLKSDLEFEFVKEIIEEEGKKNVMSRPDKYWELPYEERQAFDCCSGMGELLKVLNWKDVFEQYKEWDCVASKYDQYTPEVWALNFDESLEELQSMVWVDIDHSRYATIRYILENFWVNYVDTYAYWEKDPETDKLIRVITKEMYNALPENRKHNDH